MNNQQPFHFFQMIYNMQSMTDKLIAATRPLDTSGAEEILEEEEG